MNFFDDFSLLKLIPKDIDTNFLRSKTFSIVCQSLQTLVYVLAGSKTELGTHAGVNLTL